MVMFKAVVIVCNLAVMTIYLMFLRNEKSDIGKIGFGILAALMLVNSVLIW